MARTTTVKNLDELFFYAVKEVTEEPTRVGTFKCTGPSAGTYTAENAIPSPGKALYVKVAGNPSQNDAAATLTLTGSPGGTVEIPAGADVNSGYLVSDSTQTAITDVSIDAEGVNGDVFEIWWLPTYLSDTYYVKHVTNFNFDEGADRRPIHDKFDVDHYKRTRSEKTIGLTQKFTNFALPLHNCTDQKITVVGERRDDAGADITEYYVWYGVMFPSRPLTGAEGDTDDAVAYAGTFEHFMHYSG